MTDDELLTVDEVAERLKLHPETIRRWIRSRKLRAIRLGATRSGYRVRMSEVERLLNSDQEQREAAAA